jgi:formate/nitrite transporter FocA (FNT family)
MTPDKIDRTFISMFSKFIVCVNVLIIKVCAMYMSASYDDLADKYVSSNYGWLVVCHDGLNFVIKHFFDVLMYSIDL